MSLPNHSTVRALLPASIKRGTGGRPVFFQPWTPISPRPSTVRALLLLPPLLLATARAADDPPHLAAPVSFFASGDQLPGAITRIEAPDNADFESPVLTEKAAVDLSKLLEIRGEAPAPAGAGGPEAVLTLTNGDNLRGQLAGLDDHTVILDTTYAGRLSLRRSMVDSLVVNDQPRAIFQGPTSIDDWKTSGEPDAWRFDNGSFVSKAAGNIGRDIGLPEKSAVAFDLAWRGSLRFRLTVCSDQADSDNPPNAYSLVCQRRFVYLNKRWSEGGESGSTFIGNNGNVAELSSKEKVRIELRTDRKAGLFVLFIDDRRVASWIDADPQSGHMGGAIHFSSEDTSPLQISRIRVTAWDGKDDDAEEEAGKKLQAEESKVPDGAQRIALRNGDQVTGVVTGVENGTLKIHSAHGDIRLPVPRMRSVALHTGADRKKEIELGNWEGVKLMTGDVRAWFPEGGHVVFRLDAIDKGRLEGYSQTFGKAAFRIDAFQRIEFNIYNGNFDALRQKGTW